MQTISAANNLIIQINDGHWRLLSGQTNDSTSYVEATASGLTYQPSFARARSLSEGMVAAQAIDRVIVGWETGNWHLGVLFTAEFAQARGGRWCGIARWADEGATAQAETAEAAGKALAATLDKPFRFVPVQMESATEVRPVETAQITPQTMDIPALERPKLPNVQPMTPPIAVSEWALMEDRVGLNWQRSRGWRTEAIGRMIFFGALSIIFGLLSVGELRSNYAPVQPEWLPIVGVIVAVIMAINALYHLGTLIMTNAVQFDPRSRMIRWIRRPMGVVKQVPFERVQYLLVSHAITRREVVNSGGSQTPIERIYPEVWIHAVRDKGDFLEVGHVGQTEGRAVRLPPHEPRHPLELEEIDTPAHQAALYLAHLMEVPVLVEDRG